MGLKFNPLLNNGFDFTGTGGGGGGVTSVNGISGAVILAAGTNITLVPAGNTITINSSGGSGTVWGTITGTLSNQTDLQTALNAKANISLSNLASTAVNTDISPVSDSNINLGTASLRWGTLYTRTVNAGAANLSLTGSGITANGLRIQSVGTPTVSTDAATKGYVDGLSFANTSLSNLSSTAVNDDIIPQINNFINLGSLSKKWSNVYSTNFSGTFIGLTASGTSQQAVMGGNTFVAPSGVTVGAYFLNTGFVGTNSLGVFTTDDSNNNATSSGQVRIESGNKTAGTGNSGNIVIQTGTSSGGTRGSITLSGSSVNVNSTQIHNVVDPTSPQDAATKAYVDSVAVATTFNKENITLNGTDITNQYVDLVHLVKVNSLTLAVNKTYQVEGDDYILSTVGLITRLTFNNDLATGGVSALVAGNILNIQYTF